MREAGRVMTPLVSVVIPTYNTAAEYLRASIDSALGQSYRPLEVIVVDDGSTLDTRWIAEAYGKRIRYVRKENGGPASARNLGIRLAGGEYIALLDADDVWEHDKVEAQMTLFARQPSLGLVYSLAAAMDSAERPIRRSAADKPKYAGRIFRQLFMRNFIGTSAAIVYRRCFQEVGGFDEAKELISVEDYDMWLRIVERYEVAYVGRPLVTYRMHERGISRDTARSYLGERLVIERAVARHAATRPISRRLLQRRFARLFFECGLEYWSGNKRLDARVQFLESLRHAPWNLKAWGYCAATFLGDEGAEVVRRVKRALICRGPVQAGAVPVSPKRPPGAATSPDGARMRLMHVLFSLQTGGAEHVVLNLARKLNPERYELHVCSLSGEGELAPEFRRLGVRVHTLIKRSGIDLTLCVTLTRLFRRERIQIVHTHNVAPWLYAGLAAKLSGAALYHTEHSNVFAHQRALLLAERVLAAFTRVIISDSDKVKRQLVERQGIPSRKIVTIVNGIETSLFRNEHEADKEQARRAIGVNGAAPVIGTVGRLAAVKDQQTLLEAFRQIVSHYPEALLLIVGEGPMRQELEDQTRSLGLGAHVKFLGRRSDIPELLRLLDVFVLSSVSEGLPLTVLEAMAAGVPVVATDVGGLCEVVTDRETGLLVPPRSPTHLAAAVVTLLNDHAMRTAIRHMARQRVRTRFDLDQMVQAYEAAYHHEPLS